MNKLKNNKPEQKAGEEANKENTVEKNENNLLKIQHNLHLCDFLTNKNTLGFLVKIDDLIKEMESKKLASLQSKEEKSKKVQKNKKKS